MDVIEFLERTERKNIQNFIGVQVKKKLIECENALNERRQQLKKILEFENVQHSGELVQLVKEKLNDQMKRRLNWINTKCMERLQAEEELLAAKRQQRELENCEAWRHLQSKQLLLDSKKGQLYQIEDKRLRTEKENQIDRMWHNVMLRLNSEMEQQEIYANKLLKVIERTNQSKNLETDDSNRKRQEQESKQTKQKFQKESEKALLLEDKFRKDEYRKQFFNKMQQDQMLKTQISANYEKKTLELQLRLKETRLKKEIQDREALSELEQNKRKKLYNNEWQKHYLKNSFKEKQEKMNGEMELKRMYFNTGCILEQIPKKPYRKNTR